MSLSYARKSFHQVCEMLRFGNHFVLLIAIIASLASASPAVAQIEQLARRVPSTANALIVINARSAYNSPLAEARNWNQSGVVSKRDGMVELPSRADQILMAAEFDYEFVQPLWEVAVASATELPPMQELANRSGAQLDRIAASQIFERANDSVVAKLGTKVIGAWAPANRQQVSRWLRESHRRKQPELSEYLTDAIAKAADETNHVVLALDLQGLLDPAEVAQTLAKRDDVPKANAESVAEVIASLRGARLEVQLENPAQGSLTLDFERETESLSGFAKPLLLQALSKNGLNIDDIQAWNVRSIEKSIVLDGEVSPAGLRRILSVLTSPVGPLTKKPSEESIASGISVDASQEYFQAVVNYLNDLFFSDQKPRSLHEEKVWIERYAHKIEDLVTYQVDPDLVDFGQQAAGSLREILSVINRAQTRSDLRESTIDIGGQRRYGRYGAYGYYEKAGAKRDRQLIQADEAGRGWGASQAIVEELRSLSSQTRAEMTARYNRQF